MGMKLLPLPKAKQFRMATRFYDPQQEGVQEMGGHIQQEIRQNNESPFPYGANIKGKFRNAGKRINSKTIEQARKKSGMRLIYILIILVALFYFFLK